MQVLEAAPDVTLVRRCADVAELLSAGAAGVARVAVVSPDLRGLDRDALRHLAGHGLRVAGLVAPDDDEGERRLRQLGVATILRPSDAAPAVSSALVALAAATTSGAPAGHQASTGSRPVGCRRARSGGRPHRRRHPRRRRPTAHRPPRRSPWCGGPPGPRVAPRSRSPSPPSWRPPACAPCWSTSTRGEPAWPRCWAWSTRRPESRRRPGPPSRAPSTCPGWPGSPPRSCPACGCSPACPGPTGGPSCGPRRSTTCCAWPVASSSTSWSTSASRSRTTRSSATTPPRLVATPPPSRRSRRPTTSSPSARPTRSGCSGWSGRCRTSPCCRRRGPPSWSPRCARRWPGDDPSAPSPTSSGGSPAWMPCASCRGRPTSATRRCSPAARSSRSPRAPTSPWRWASSPRPSTPAPPRSGARAGARHPAWVVDSAGEARARPGHTVPLTRPTV